MLATRIEVVERPSAEAIDATAWELQVSADEVANPAAEAALEVATDSPASVVVVATPLAVVMVDPLPPPALISTAIPPHHCEVMLFVASTLVSLSVRYCVSRPESTTAPPEMLARAVKPVPCVRLIVPAEPFPPKPNAP